MLFRWRNWQVDRWALSKTADLVTEITKAMEVYELHRVVQLINRFCQAVLSSTYHDIIKDRLTHCIQMTPREGLRKQQSSIFLRHLLG